MKANIVMLSTFQQYNFFVAEKNTNVVNFRNKIKSTIQQIDELNHKCNVLLNKAGKPKESGFFNSIFGDTFTKGELFTEFESQNAITINSTIDTSSIESLAASLHALAEKIPIPAENGLAVLYSFVGHFYMLKLACNDCFISEDDDFNEFDGNEFISNMFFFNQAVKYYHGFSYPDARKEILKGIKHERSSLQGSNHSLNLILTHLIDNFDCIFDQFIRFMKQEILEQFNKVEPILSRPYRTLLELNIFNEYIPKGYFIDLMPDDLAVTTSFIFMIGKKNQEPLNEHEANAISEFFINDVKLALQKANVTPKISIDDDNPLIEFDDNGNLLITISPFNINGSDEEQKQLETA